MQLPHVIHDMAGCLQVCSASNAVRSCARGSLTNMMPAVQILYTTACCDRQPTGDGSFLPLQVRSCLIV